MHKSISMLCLLLAGCAGTEGDGDKTCSDFTCQGAAQAWLLLHPDAGLDGDNDGLACESLPLCLPHHEHAGLPSSGLAGHPTGEAAREAQVLLLGEDGQLLNEFVVTY